MSLVIYVNSQTPIECAVNMSLFKRNQAVSTLSRLLREKKLNESSQTWGVDRREQKQQSQTQKEQQCGRRKLYAESLYTENIVFRSYPASIRSEFDYITPILRRKSEEEKRNASEKGTTCSEGRYKRNRRQLGQSRQKDWMW